MKHIEKDAFITHLYISDDLQLYIVVSTKDSYKVYEKSLERIYSVTH